MTRDGSPMYPLVGQPQMAMGGSMPGAVGFMYAREGAPRNFGGKMTVPSAEDGTELQKAYAKWPALRNMGSSAVNKDYGLGLGLGYGAIEFMHPELKQVTYDNGTLLNQAPGKNSITYNPLLANEQNIRLDMLHGMHQDPTFNTHREAFKQSVLGDPAIKGDMDYWYNEDKKKGRAEDGREQWMNNYVDGQMRTLLFEGDRSKSNYSDEEANQLLSNPKIKKNFNKLNNYLKTGYSYGQGPRAQNGMEMKYYQDGLDWKPRSMADGGDIVPGENEEVQLPSDKKFVDDFGNSLEELGIFSKPTVDSYSQKLANDLTPIDANNFIPGMEDKFDVMNKMFNDKFDKFGQVWDTNNRLDTTGSKNIKLNTGRFRGAKVPTNIIDELAKTSREQKVPLGQLLALVGRESTFGSSMGKDNDRAGNKTDLISGWNVAEQYQPYLHVRFLADNKVPGIKPRPTPHGYEYEITNEKAMDDYLRKNPKLLDQYKAKLDSIKSVGNQDAFDLAAKFLKKKGIQGYNPGDPTYIKAFNTDYNLLKQDKGLMNYLNQKGYQFEQGGQLTKLDQLTNFTNYNTKQSSGWLDKYND
jgi:hypothetical protein